MTIEELCERSYKTAVDKGWHQEPQSFGEVTALFHSEVSEALEIWRDPARTIAEAWESEGGKPEGFVIELADLLIRIGDTCVEMGFPLARVVSNTTVAMLGYGMEDGAKSFKNLVADGLTHLHFYLSKAFEIHEKQEIHMKVDVALMLGKAIVWAGILCRLNGLDLEKALTMKMAYNETRSHRHGGKRA